MTLVFKNVFHTMFSEFLGIKNVITHPGVLVHLMYVFILYLLNEKI